MNQKKHISVVSPIYGCAACLAALHERIVKTVSVISENYEIIFVNDAGPDDAWNEITRICNLDPKVKGINLSRNFGQHYAIFAGLEYSNADWVVVMDCDLQDQPEEILNFYHKALEGYEIVMGRRKVRKDNFFKKLTSKAFAATFNFLSDFSLNSEVSNFGIYSGKVISNVLRYREDFQVFGVMVCQVGFRKAEIDISHMQRETGKSGYSFYKRLSLASNLILSFTDKPLRILFVFGLFVSTMAFCFGFYFIFDFYYSNKPVSGWTSLIVSLFFISGILFSSIGLVGLYIGKIFRQVKSRPLYIVKDELNV